MIDTKISPTARSFAAALTRKAAVLAEAQGESALRARADDPARWRLPRLIWPLFTKG